MEQLEQSLTICLAAFERCRSPGEGSQIGGGRRSKPLEQRETVETEAGLLRERVRQLVYNPDVLARTVRS